ncbi:MAG: hypothetical protein LC800_17275 [Acidobacteria bacterium]|nr:hypothetical protein [Acidobacteriota bacterium]
MIGRRLTRLGGRRLVRAAARLFAPCLLACLLCGAVAAYTVVMRGGRRVEIPGGFELTRTSLTYEAAPGVSVTLPLDHIDVEATERANDEPPGSFLRRVRGGAGPGRARQTGSPAVAPGGARRTITNRDLEAVRRARVESERDYERRREELGLPSAEEMRLHEERETEHMRELSRQKAAADAAAERERRARDEELQAEMFLLDAEDYNARRLAEPSGDYSGYYSSGLTVITGGRPYYGRRFPPTFRRPPFGSSRPAGFGAFGPFGARRRPPARHGAFAGFGVNGGTRGVVGFRYRGFGGRPAGRR